LLHSSLMIMRRIHQSRRLNQLLVKKNSSRSITKLQPAMDTKFSMTPKNITMRSRKNFRRKPILRNPHLNSLVCPLTKILILVRVCFR
jgi:hypothetical protein